MGGFDLAKKNTSRKPKRHPRLAASIARAAGTVLSKSAVDHSRQNARRESLGLPPPSRQRLVTITPSDNSPTRSVASPAVVAAVLQAAGSVANPKAAAALDILLADYTDLSQIKEWDATALEEALTMHPEWKNLTVDRQRRARRVLWAAKMHPDLDPNGRFASHLRQVPRAWMTAYPDLWRLPARFAIRMQREQSTDVPLLIAVARRVIDVALQQYPQRTPERVTRSTLLRLNTLLSAWRPCLPVNDPTYRSLFSAVTIGCLFIHTMYG